MNPKSLALTGGVMISSIALILMILHKIAGLGHKSLSLLMECCPMYSSSIVGSIVGVVFAFVLGYVLFYLFATIHHFLDS